MMKRRMIMLIKKHTKDGITYWMRANFKNRTAYTDIIQITLEKPWLIPKYEDDFGGWKGLRLYGWLFFYFGRVYEGMLIPMDPKDVDVKKPLVDKNGNKWSLIPKDKMDDFKAIKKNTRFALRRKWNITYERNYNDDGTYSITQIIHDSVD